MRNILDDSEKQLSSARVLIHEQLQMMNNDLEKYDDIVFHQRTLSELYEYQARASHCMDVLEHIIAKIGQNIVTTRRFLVYAEQHPEDRAGIKALLEEKKNE